MVVIGGRDWGWGKPYELRPRSESVVQESEEQCRANPSMLSDQINVGQGFIFVCFGTIGSYSACLGFFLLNRLFMNVEPLV